MSRRDVSWFAGLFLVAGVVMALGGVARAAGEWEWTAGQGWVRGAGVARPTPKEQLHYAYELERRSEFMDAAHQYFLLVQNFPASEEAGVGLQRLARCLFEMENYYTSYKAIEQVIETYPNTGRMSDLVEIELRIAKKMMVSQTPDLLSGREERAREHNIRRALEILDSVIKHDPYGPVAAEAYLVKGEGHLFVNEVSQAKTAFETVRDEFPRSDFVERARLGILTCDSLMGQARPQEVQEQVEIVREMERERAGRYDPDEMEEMDDVEESIRQLAEVEASKMMDQAEQYRRMGTRKGVSSSEFLYKEIIRRYPDTPQADEAMGRLGNIRVPRDSSRLSKAIKNINLNPFSYTKDPEPPWIIPQMSPEDMVMVDAGLGPIAGVPESGDAPRTSYSTSVRPAGLGSSVEVMPTSSSSARSGSAGGGGGGVRNFSPVGMTPGPAPTFIDGVADKRTYSSAPEFADDPNVPPGRQQPRRPPNPLSTVSDDDLILPPGMTREAMAAQANAQAREQARNRPPAFPGDDYYAVNPTYGDGPLRAPDMPNPSLGTADIIPNSDLVGMPPQPMGGMYGQGGYNQGGYNQGGYNQGGYNQGYYPPPQQQPPPQANYYNNPGNQGGGQYGGQPRQNPRQSGGWSFGDDLW